MIERLRELLENVKEGNLSVDDAMEKLKSLPYEDIDFAKIDHLRTIIKGFPEVIFSQGKTPQQVVIIMENLLEKNNRVIATRASLEVFDNVKKRIPDAVYNETARIITVLREEINKKGKIVVACAGTADLPVAEEASITAEIMGSYVDKIYDIGVSGLHRLLSNLERFYSANAVVVVAGMEGALASVVGGLIPRPIIAVPTSVGYGANFNGLSALLTMLNSCVPGVAVVNIDNGFGAGYLANMINLMVEDKK
ncbi:MAG TPA: nickel pincer cofactor biosynthesis protein LarB [Dictyoglomaceae bacterium]|nr:nickel pincer cofactor biosynthesis protein LarB [Dictyoglomaceae bacterium]HOL39186.1 nickel pincer cofactor biosynthesis protein LarB [Dictyoglomaceae bacterium]HOP94205.1 nickel pincer cofactor biosynthesis protein LarB [Dictyoglomaceae bacterium]HPP15340.1 nickel pincer cofactor biosynthesis protein LarB [Dictyoglomaceae bacterium]HPU43614.1 nickel pincer cofactor biosynthesis protein LarB [Dictyoglomaceae bacterium]